MSLRARLVLGLLILSALGLVLLAAITYAEQRSFLLERADEQVRAAIPQVVREAARQNLEPAPGLDGPPVGGAGRPRPRRPDRDLPAGTAGQLRSVDGTVRADVVFGVDGSATRPVRFPDRLPLGRPLTLDQGGRSYRVLAEPAPPGFVTVAAVPLRDVEEALGRLLAVEAVVITAILAVLGASGWWVVGVGLRPLERIGRTADAIAAGDLDRRVAPATSRTEIGRLGVALNAMLARIEEAFAERRASEERLRRFVADASHELRTPLSSIRGYSELFRMGAGADPEQTATAMRRIEQEAERMGVLVEDLLTLARLDELRAPTREAVDVAELVRDAAADARVRAPDRLIGVEAPGPVTVLADPDQLRQVLANLVANALVHTPPGTPIELEAHAVGERARLEVRDHGAGLPPAVDQAALFERFWRAEGGRARGPGGAGLGLAIVAGIVARHGGTVRAEDAEGGGARFTIELPGADRSATAECG